ncbi:MAG: aspartate ammonia-lyase [Anaerolineae bacterium]|nr:aspartate ammonia-lyase [Anaerolineae bacterium]
MRIERDSLGQVQVPDEALWGAQTQRALENFAISGLKQDREYIVASALVKRAAAEVNMALGLLDERRGRAIVEAATQIMEGRWHEHFVVDPFQAGAGTSHNMNTNEVIANLANEALGGHRGEYSPVHPNDHVNMAQSTNDFIPTVMRISATFKVQKLLPAIQKLAEAFARKAREFDSVIKSGRTHLQDAVPIRLGQEFGAYAQAIRLDQERIAVAAERLKRLGIGGTAVGTGLNTHPRYHQAMVAKLSELTGITFRSSGNLFESMQSTADFVDLSAALRTLAVTLTRIANDLRLLSSGPTTGLAEITLPAVQPGSSIMPGKVNPVMAEMLNMVCYHVMGNDQTIMLCSQAGQLELNVMMPIMAYNLLQSLEILTNAIHAFTERCVEGIQANIERCRDFAERTMGLATALNPYIGYMAAAKVAQEALARGVPLRQVVLERGYLSAQELEAVLDPFKMTEPGIPGKELK